MLVLSRRERERIVINDDIVITVVRAGNSVKLGIEAPVKYRVLRGELLETNPEKNTSTQTRHRVAA